MPEDPIIPPADPVAAETPEEAPAPPSALDQAPLGEYVKRRAAGEKPGVPAPSSASPEGSPTEEEEAPPPPRPGETPEQAAAAKASRNRGAMQRRIDELVRQRSDYERKYNETLARLQAIESQGNGHAQPPLPPQPAPPLPQGPPVLDQMLAQGHTYEDWVDARIQWKAQEIAQAQILAVQQAQAHLQAQQSLNEALDTFGERIDQTKTQYPDYDQVVAQNEDVWLSPVMQDVAVRSEQGAELLYWLGKHPEIANELGEITRDYPAAAFPLVERHLLSLLSDARPSGLRGASAAVASSTAPAPITPLGGGSTPIAPPMDQLPLGEYVRRRNEQLRRRRGGQ